MTIDKHGVSALLLQRQPPPARYEAAWMMLHKFRRAMAMRCLSPKPSRHIIISAPEQQISLYAPDGHLSDAAIDLGFNLPNPLVTHKNVLPADRPRP
jgi:hypothetical protein